MIAAAPLHPLELAYYVVGIVTGIVVAVAACAAFWQLKVAKDAVRATNETLRATQESVEIAKKDLKLRLRWRKPLTILMSYQREDAATKREPLPRAN